MMRYMDVGDSSTIVRSARARHKRKQNSNQLEADKQNFEGDNPRLISIKQEQFETKRRNDYEEREPN